MDSGKKEGRSQTLIHSKLDVNRITPANWIVPMESVLNSPTEVIPVVVLPESA